MDYEECLKVADNILSPFFIEKRSDKYTDVDGTDELTRKIAEEIFNAFQFGIKWGNEGLNVQVS